MIKHAMRPTVMVPTASDKTGQGQCHARLSWEISQLGAHTRSPSMPVVLWTVCVARRRFLEKEMAVDVD